MLGTKSQQILRATIAALRPRTGIYAVDIDGDVLASLLGMLAYLPLPMRVGFPMGLRLLEYGPPLFGGGLRRLTSMPVADASRYLGKWEQAAGTRALLFRGLRALVMLAFYQHPSILAALEVDWPGRAAERVVRRGELLAGTPAVTSP